MAEADARELWERAVKTHRLPSQVRPAQHANSKAEDGRAPADVLKTSGKGFADRPALSRGRECGQETSREASRGRPEEAASKAGRQQRRRVDTRAAREPL